MLCLWLAASCNVPKRLGNTPPNVTKAYVKTKTSTLDAEKVTEKNKKIVADNSTFSKKIVIEYSDGKALYRNYKSKSFWPLEYTGKINVYSKEITTTSTTLHGTMASPSNPYGMSSSTHHRVVRLVQNGDGGELQSLEYKNLRNIIPPTAPAFKYLATYKRKNIVNRGLLISAATVFVSGFVLASNIPEPEKGFRMAAMGMGAAAAFGFTAMIRLGLNNFNLLRAVAKYNDVLDEKEK